MGSNLPMWPLVWFSWSCWSCWWGEKGRTEGALPQCVSSKPHRAARVCPRAGRCVGSYVCTGSSAVARRQRVVVSIFGSGPILLACPHLSLASLMHRRPSGRPLAAVPLFQGLLGPLVQILLAPPTTSASYLANRSAAASQRRVPSHRSPSAHSSRSSAPASRPLCSTPRPPLANVCDRSLTRADSHLPNTARLSSSIPAHQLNTSIPATTRAYPHHESLSSSHWPACWCPEPAPQRAARPDPRRV